MDQRTCIKFCVKNEIKCADASRMLTVAYGEATLDRSNVYRWYKMFSEGREDVNDEERAVRPSTSTTDEKINEVEKMILANRRITGMRRVASKFVPKLLNCDQKQHRMNIANEMLDSVRDDPNLLQRVITGDEAWVYGYDVDTKAQSSQWKLPHEPRPKKACQVRSNVKVLLTVFFDCRGVVHHEFLPQAIRQKRPDFWKNKNWLLHHDNAPAHTSLLVRDFLAKHNTLMRPQPPYSPDLASCDFFLFPKLKRPMKGRRYATLDEIKTASKEELKKILKNDFLKCFEDWKNRWHKCIISHGDYFEENKIEIKSKAEDCEFENIKDSLIRDRIALSCRDTTLRENILQNPDLTMSLAINQGQAAEASQKQLRNIEKDSIDAIRKNFNEKYKPTTSLKNSYTSNPVRANFNKLMRCSKCSMAHDFGKCPAYVKECYKCRKPNHFSNCCKNRSVRCIQESDEEKDNLLIIDSIMVGQVLRKPWKELIYIQGHPVDVKLDTGADVNILPEKLIKEWPNMPLLETADCKIYTYTGQQIPVVGKCQLDCLDEFVNLNLLKRVETISEISVTLTGLLDEYKDVFKGNVHLSYIYDIKISDKAEPKISPARRLPRALLQPDIIWNWNIAADQELNFIKTLLTSPPVLRHFDPNEPLELFADASKDGLGAILMQKEKPLSYASASLTSPQKPYSQIEKELLALYFGCKRFHYFLYGRKFTAYTDHKPLVSLLKKTLIKCHLDSKGWPLHKKNLPFNLKPYWKFKEELLEWQNLICRGNKLLIPKTQRSDILKILHASHQGRNITIALAKGFIYWPGMNKEIEELINNCSICQQTSRANLKEPMLPHQAPDYPWQKVGIDISQIESLRYLLIVDYFSNYPEIYKLQDMTTDTIIRKLKRTLSNFGIPETLVSDNGPPFFSKEFQNFTSTWNIVHVTSSPYHAQSNGMVERKVQTLKKLMKRCREERTDPYFALLNLRNTPHNNLPSPAQILMSRKLRSIMPSKTSQFVPSMINNEAIQKQLVDNQVKMKNYYDRHNSPGDPLSINDRVWFQKDKRWIPGQITNQAIEPRSFYVKYQEGNEYKRNSIHIRKDK
ncbi:K02A2.6-like [Cordylochernes scorpioides]|uniref:RNA-directed DNA polymerase n=1 Tax=Cordylochernes scorpioides TaxID=51811 RepID=A0ABY6LDL0_9ARAC|nr:K02A2.6-like [Cordylochernes scorpioides]